MDISGIYEVYLNSSGVSTDTRKINEGVLFFALKGDNFNGNAYAEEALKKGAAKAIIDEEQYAGPGTILVEDVLKTLQQLATHHRRQLKIPFVALTGSNGKTTTKELMNAVLSTKYNVLATAGNYNNHIGVPLTLLSIRSDHELAIIEMGANHQKEIAFLCTIAEPDFGYITNFGKAHLEGFGGVEGVIKGKGELYDFIIKSDGTLFVNEDDPIQVRLSGKHRQVGFGTGNNTENQYRKLPNDPQGHTRIEFMGQEVNSLMAGDYNAPNIAAALAVGRYFGVPLPEMVNAISEYTPTNNRSQLMNTGRNQLIVDAYNANPSSMELALLNFSNFSASEKWVVAGDMFEMGEHEHAEHQNIVDIISKQSYEKVLLVGKAFAKTSGEAHRFETTSELEDFLKDSKPEGKTILIKGSRGMQLEKLIPLL